MCFKCLKKIVIGRLRRVCGWRGWRLPARLSLPVMLSHWIVAVAIAARPVAYYTSVFDTVRAYLENTR